MIKFTWKMSRIRRRCYAAHFSLRPSRRHTLQKPRPCPRQDSAAPHDGSPSPPHTQTQPRVGADHQVSAHTEGSLRWERQRQQAGRRLRVSGPGEQRFCGKSTSGGSRRTVPTKKNRTDRQLMSQRMLRGDLHFYGREEVRIHSRKTKDKKTKPKKKKKGNY